MLVTVLSVLFKKMRCTLKVLEKSAQKAIVKPKDMKSMRLPEIKRQKSNRPCPGVTVILHPTKYFKQIKASTKCQANNTLLVTIMIMLMMMMMMMMIIVIINIAGKRSLGGKENSKDYLR